ncbi:MAG: hypothetical protein ACSHYB_12980 [Roseibacillus sp.]
MAKSLLNLEARIKAESGYSQTFLTHTDWPVGEVEFDSSDHTGVFLEAAGLAIGAAPRWR